MKIRLMLADDHCMFRDALRNTLAAELDMEIVNSVGTGQEVIDSIEIINPDILILDIALPDMSGIDVARRVLKKHPDTRIVALSGYVYRMFVSEMINAGARAYVVKSAKAEELFAAIRTVNIGKTFLSPEITSGLVRNALNADEKPPITVLTEREREVLSLLATGMQSKHIAEQLGISAETIKSYRRNIKQKLNISSTAELTRYAIREGLQSV